MASKILGTFLWLLPYLISGFSAPFIFKRAPTPQIGGHYAGGLFIFAVIWALLLSLRHGFPLGAKIFFLIFAGLTIFFWAWRFSNDVPLKQAQLLGLSGSLWHGGLTSLYLVGALLLGIFEFKRA